MQNIRDISSDQLAQAIKELGEPGYRADQVTAWLFANPASSFDDMSNISKDLRAKLKARFSIKLPEITDRVRDPDTTEKLLFKLEDGAFIESVLIPMKEGKFTLCISSQVGCKLGCHFCRTGYGGFERNLTTSEIVGQVLAAKRLPEYGDNIRNIVFMGMGEPLDNLDNVLPAVKIIVDPEKIAFSHRRVTMSTAGLLPGLKLLGEESQVNLAISLNAADDETRTRLMPINKRYPLIELLNSLAKFPLPNRKRITFEYIMISGINDRDQDMKNLARLIGGTSGLKAKINLIAYNPSPELPEFSPSSISRIERFQQYLADKNISVFIRASRGQSIFAACGQLAGKPKK
jgi:23S rRNA (adenine2503-C2)-methyltransferase